MATSVIFPDADRAILRVTVPDDSEKCNPEKVNGTKWKERKVEVFATLTSIEPYQLVDRLGARIHFTDVAGFAFSHFVTGPIVFI